MTIQPLSSAGCAAVSGSGQPGNWSSSPRSSGVSASDAADSSWAGQAQLSPGARLLNELQKLAQEDPAEFQQVTASMASSLQKEAQQAQQSGNSTDASELNQLATALTSASQTGDLAPLQTALQQQASGTTAGSGETTATQHQYGGDDSTGGSTSRSSSTGDGDANSTTNSNLAAYRQNASSGSSTIANLWTLFQAAEGIAA